MNRIPALLVAAAVGALAMGATYAGGAVENVSYQRPAPVAPILPSQSVRLVPTAVDITVRPGTTQPAPLPGTQVRTVSGQASITAVTRDPAPVVQVVVEVAPEVETTTPTAEPVEPQAPGTTSPPPPPAPVTPPPPIIDIVIAWDGIKCAKSESWWEERPNKVPVLLCPLSIRP